MASPPRPVLLDCDPGLDDAVASLLAAALEDIHLLGITTVAGNSSLENTTRNALTVCELAGLDDVPVAAGMARPIVRGRIEAERVRRYRPSSAEEAARRNPRRSIHYRDASCHK